MAASAVTTRVTGLKETLRALSLVNKAARKVVVAELALAVKPIVTDTQAGVGVFQGASVSTIGPRVSTKSVFVTQRARKVTGLRGDFGAKQMLILLEAAARHEDEMVDSVGDALDRLADRAGF